MPAYKTLKKMAHGALTLWKGVAWNAELMPYQNCGIIHMKKCSICYLVGILFVFVVLVILLLGLHPYFSKWLTFSIFAIFVAIVSFSLLKCRLSKGGSVLLSLMFAFPCAWGALMLCERVYRSHYAPVLLPIYQFSYHVQTNKPYVALTFDDGPEGERTEQILDVLAAHNARATFFVQGHKAVEQRSVIERMFREHHEVANHSWNHPCLGELTFSELTEQVVKTNEAIRSITNQNTVRLRPPYGRLTWCQGWFLYPAYTDGIIYWDTGLDHITDDEMIKKRVTRGSIILLHDYMTSPKEVEHIVQVLQDEGYIIVSVDELLQSRAK